MNSLRLLVADDHEIVRRGLCAVLQQQSGWIVAAQAGTGREAVEKAREFSPDVAILDISMPDLNGVEATRLMRKATPQIKVLALTMYDNDLLIREALDAGVNGFLMKSDAATELISAVETIRSNKSYFTGKVAQMVMDGFLVKRA